MSNGLFPDRSDPYWRVQVNDEDESFSVVTPIGNSFTVSQIWLEQELNKAGFEANKVINYIWNFKAARIDFQRMRFDAIIFIEKFS